MFTMSCLQRTAEGIFITGKSNKEKIMNLIFIPTLKCNYNCDYCYIDNNKMLRNAELALSDYLLTILNSFESISVNGGEPLLYSQLNELIKNTRNIKVINSSLNVKRDLIENVLLHNSDIKFNVTYQGISDFRRPFNKKIRNHIYEFKENINSFHYVFFIKNFYNIEKDLEEINSFDKQTEFILYYEKDDLDFVESFNKNDRNNLKDLLLKVFPSDTFETKTLENKKDFYHIGPYNTNIYFSRQNINRLNCKNCYPLTSGRANCQGCLTYKGTSEFDPSVKSEYINSFNKFKDLLNI